MDKDIRTRGIRPDRPPGSDRLRPDDNLVTDQDRVRHALSIKFTELVGELRRLGWRSSDIANATKLAGFGAGGDNPQEALGRLEETVERAKAES